MHNTKVLIAGAHLDVMLTVWKYKRSSNTNNTIRASWPGYLSRKDDKTAIHLLLIWIQILNSRAKQDKVHSIDNDCLWIDSQYIDRETYDPCTYYILYCM